MLMYFTQSVEKLKLNMHAENGQQTTEISHEKDLIESLVQT